MSRSDYSEAPAIGNAIETNTKSYDRIYGMLLGVRVHVSRISAQPIIPLERHHFEEYEKIDIPREGNHYAPAHSGNYDYKFKTYSPVAFQYLRHFFGISDDEYLMSLTADYMMSELKTIGRSSAMFYYTWDGRYVLKTLTKSEMSVLRQILPSYYEYVTTHPDTLVNQFFGAYRSQTSIGKVIRFVIMNNVFPIGYQIHYKFDLKGSTVNRAVDPAKLAKPGSTWKENEFSQKRYLSVGPRDWALLKAQLQDDTNFLARVGVMDYSLLVGIHKFNPDSPFLHPALGEKIELFSFYTPDVSATSRYRNNSMIVRKRRLKGGRRNLREETEPTVKASVGNIDHTQSNWMVPYQANENQKLLSFCGGLRATNERDEPLSEIYFLGLIDFLQTYNVRKTAEHALKSIVYKADEMSCIPPDRYAQRLFYYILQTVGPREVFSTPVESDILRRRVSVARGGAATIGPSGLPIIRNESSGLFSPEKPPERKETKEERRKRHEEKRQRRERKRLRREAKAMTLRVDNNQSNLEPLTNDGNAIPYDLPRSSDAVPTQETAAPKTETNEKTTETPENQP